MTITSPAVTQIHRSVFEVFFTAPDGQLLTVVVDSDISLEDYETALQEAILATRN